EFECAQRGQHFLAAAGLARHLHLGHEGNDLLQAIANDGVIVGDQEANHGAASCTVCFLGNLTSMRVPASGRLCTTSVPPSMKARSRMPTRPRPFRRLPLAAMPRPLSVMVKVIACASSASSTTTVLAPLWRLTLVSASCTMRKIAVPVS